MPIDVRVRYQDLQEISKEISNAAKYIDDHTLAVVQGFMVGIKAGDLEGKAAEQLIEGFTRVFEPAIGRLRDKMQAVSKEIGEASSVMQQQDDAAAKRFQP